MTGQRTRAKVEGPFTYEGWTFYRASTWDAPQQAWRDWFTYDATAEGKKYVEAKVAEYNAKAKAERNA